MRRVYTYDQVGNRTTRNDGTSTILYLYDYNNKLTGIKPYGQPGPPPKTFGYDGAGNMTSTAGPMYGSKTLTYDDESRLSSIAYGAVTDTYTYNWQGLRTRAYLNGVWYRYLYNGERVLQELTNAGGVNATYTTENDSYYGALLHLKRATGESRFPLYDEIGSARGLVDASGTVTDAYDMDTFGKPIGSTGSTPNPYRYGAAWGYITDPSGFLQLGARYYWPEVGRFVQQDPVKEDASAYVYGDANPLARVDPDGHCDFPPPSPAFRFRKPRFHRPDLGGSLRKGARRMWRSTFGEGGVLGPLPGYSKCKEAADRKHDQCMKRAQPCHGGLRAAARGMWAQAKCNLRWNYDRAKCDWKYKNPFTTPMPSPDVITPVP
ncbi:MAG: RHS repeat domain-containing protein [Armatimonadota bacterium]